ncbi:hypothetical protein F5146DRAFT_1135028 [Armillaria mellea]|nr:hypothetical protein F5146DRAFT_1135028 [Armillaria mellea]
MDKHDEAADGLRLKRALSEERKRQLAALVAPVDEHYRRIKEPGYFDQLNVAPESACPQESSSNVDYAAVFTEAMNTLSGLRREYAAFQGPQDENDLENDLIRWARTQFHILQTVAVKKGGSPVAAIQSQYELKWNRLMGQSDPTTAEPVGGTMLYTFPWPSLMFVATLDDLTEFRVRQFFLNPEGHLANRMDVLEEELVKWHPGTLSQVLHLVIEKDRESIQKGAEIVVESIMGLLQGYACSA